MKGRPPAGGRVGRGPVAPGSVSLAALVLSVALLATGCGFAARVVVTAEPSPQPSTELTTTLALLRTEVMSVLGAASFQVQDARSPYRPGESASVAAAPRIVLQALIPDEPDAGYVVLYEFPDPGAASAAARELADYVGSGIGRVQFPVDARFTIRQVGAGLVTYVWSPGASADPNAERGIETALASLGQGYAVGG